jgi:hypothetical protein
LLSRDARSRIALMPAVHKSGHRSILGRVAWRRWSLVLLALIVLVLAGCNGNTTPATNVTKNSATLHADVAWLEGDQGTYWWEYSKTGGAPWTEVPIPHTAFGPMGSAGSGSISRNVTGLTPDSHYVYRLAYYDPANPPGGTWHADHDGACEYPGANDPCTNYDDFDTPPDPFAGLPARTNASIVASDYATTASPGPWKLITDGFYYGTLSGSDRCGGSAWNDTTDVQVNRSATGGDPNPAFDDLVHTGYRTLHSGDGTGGFGPQSRYDYLPGSQDPDCDNQPDSTRAQLGGLGALDSFYRAPVGTRTLFGFSVRLENPARVNKALSTGGGNTKFSQIVQVKSTDPGTSGGPLLSMLEGTNGVKLVYNSQTDPATINENLICSTCAAPGNVTVPRGVWLRFALDVDWETSSSGAYRLWGDLDGDAVRDFVPLTLKINEQTVKSGFSYATPNIGPYHHVCTGSCDSSDTSGLPTNGRDYASVEILQHAVGDSWGP